MSNTLPDHVDLRQLRTRAKELLHRLQRAEPEAREIAARHDFHAQPNAAKLADAQRLIARELGFKSWPALVEQLETPTVLAAVHQALTSGNGHELDRLLRRKKWLRNRINEPIMSFDSPPIVAISSYPNAAELIPVLIRHGADPNARSRWWAGGYSALDFARGRAAEILVEHGATFDVWSAAAHGRIDLLGEILDRAPELIDARGGDGETPLHFAADQETARFLLKRGANVSIRDVDHESTALQYHIRKPDLLEVLLEYGAEPDIFVAAAMDDAPMLRRVLDKDPGANMHRVGRPPFTTQKSNGGHIYTYVLGNWITPQQLAVDCGSHRVLELLLEGTTVTRQVVTAAWAGDETAVRRLVAKDASLPDEDEMASLAFAAQSGRTEAVRLLLLAKFDPMAPGMDSGTALHVASWFGQLATARLLIPVVPIDTLDAHHGGTPLRWAFHGLLNCRNPEGNYPGLVEALLDAGADLSKLTLPPGGSALDLAGDRLDVREVLKRRTSG